MNLKVYVMSKRLKDKIAVITGGAKGLGACIAETFYKEGARIQSRMAGRAFPQPSTTVDLSNHSNELGRACEDPQQSALHNYSATPAPSRTPFQDWIMIHVKHLQITQVDYNISMNTL